MSDFLLFLGRFHVLVLHLPIGMVILTAIVHWLSRDIRNTPLQQALPLLWGCTAFSALVTVILGMLHFGEGGFSGPSANAHRLWGIGFAVGVQVAWFLCVFNINFYRRWGSWLTFALLGAVTMTGHYGGNLTHGSTYLVEYAPQSIRSMAGLDERRPVVTDIGEADPWHDIVKPMLQSRCSSCHNADKQRGQLDLSSLDALMVGGESGAVVLAGNAAGSDMFKRVTLPENHDNFMPAEGKTPLTESQVQILGWWIDAGLPTDTAIGNITLDQDVWNVLAMELGIFESVGLRQVEVYPATPQSTLDQLVEYGWLVRPLSLDSNALVVGINAVGQPVSRAMLEALMEVNTSVVELNLASTGLNNELLAVIREMPVLEKLNLSNNGIGDSGMDVIINFRNLEMLNIYGNPDIHDNGLQKLASLQNLESLYLWGTGVSAEGIATLQNIVPDLEIQAQALPR